MTTLTDAQFQQLLATITQNAQPQPAPVATAASTTTGHDPNALGPMPPCIFDTNKMTRLTQFEHWLEEAENRMRFIGVADDDKKAILLRSWGGSELVQFMRTHAKVKFEATPASEGTAAVPADTYSGAVKKIKDELRKLVNRTMAMHQLFSTKQGDRSWMDFIKVLEDKAHILGFATTPYTESDAVKDAAIFGMADERLQEKALAEDPDLPTLIQLGQSRESGREGLHSLKDNLGTVSRVAQDSVTVDDVDKRIQQVMRIQKPGRYSNRQKRQNQRPAPTSCTNCSARHIPGACKAQGKTCFACGESNHFEGSQICKGTPQSVSRVQETDQAAGSYTQTVLRDWPGVKSDRSNVIQSISAVNKINDDSTGSSKHVSVDIGGSLHRLQTDTGSDYTIIPPSSYSENMGEVVPADTNLRAWGSESNLKVCGMVNTLITTKKGARVRTNVYIVDGFLPEPVLGDREAERLGFVTFNKEG